MCLGGGGGRMTTPKREYQNRPVTVTGEQTGVDNPKDTAKATEALMIKRRKEEGTYADPNLTTAEKLATRGGSMGTTARTLRSARLRSGLTRGPNAPSKAQKMAAARKAKKSTM
jgi:hypothetical protein|tara:strand:- start:313 stop:654 length:342 start_codon:yes stop_codon:yes gene_type:complete